VRAEIRVGRVSSKKLKQEPRISKSKKANSILRKTARRTTAFKSDSWYASAALSIGVRASADTI
jgi:hypothetical protein